MAKKRRVMSRKESKKVFNRGTAVKGKNVRVMPMRGGIRL